MKYIYLLIFFVSYLCSQNALAFWTKVSNSQKEYCLNKSERFGSSSFANKKRYQQCIRELKEHNKKQRLVDKYYDDCYPDLFEDFKLEAQNIIKKWKDSEMVYLNLNPEDNSLFYLTDHQKYLLYGLTDFLDRPSILPTKNIWVYPKLNALRDRFEAKLVSCAENKSKPFFKF